MHNLSPTDRAFVRKMELEAGEQDALDGLVEKGVTTEEAERFARVSAERGSAHAVYLDHLIAEQAELSQVG
jgi:hypothetical protein